MSWIHQEILKHAELATGRSAVSMGENRFESVEQEQWAKLKQQIQDDVEEFRGNGGGAELRETSSSECMVSNTNIGLAVRINADFAAHNIRYDFESSARRMAPPVGGVFSIRGDEKGSAEIYSADQRVSSEQARRMLLAPVFFPDEPAQ